MTKQFAITVKGGSVFHVVDGDLAALSDKDAWRKPECTLCGRDVVPHNYYEAPCGRVCEGCAARLTAHSETV